MDNEELVKQIQAGKDRKKNLSLLWEQNQGIIGMMVHQLTGLQSYEDGFEDAKQQSYFGLLEAIEGYKPEIGVKFFTYAEGKIKKAIYRYHANTGYIVRVPEYLQNRMKKYSRFCKAYKEQNGMWPDDEICMKALPVSKRGLEHLKKMNHKMAVINLEKETWEGKKLLDSVSATYNLEELITGNMYLKELHEVLSKAIEILTEEEKEILVLHFYQGYKIDIISQRKGLSRQTIYNRLDDSYRKIRESKYRNELEEFREYPFREMEQKKERQYDFQNMSEKERGLML